MLRPVLLGLGGEGHRGCVCVCESHSVVFRLFATSWTTALQAVLSMGSKILE